MVNTGGPRRIEPTLTARSDIDNAVIELKVYGRWSRHLPVLAATGISKCFAESPRAVIVDLLELEDPLAASAPTWFTAGLRGRALGPPVPVLVCLPPAAPLAVRLGRMGARWSLPLYASVPQARTAVAGRLPLTERERLRLAPEPDAARLARDLVAKACRAWHLKKLRHPAQMVACELVLNAVEHAGTPIEVTVSKRGRGLHLAVADHDPRLPRLLDPASAPPGPAGEYRGQGLRVVHAVATSWGAMPTTTGKVVWTIFQERKPRRSAANPARACPRHGRPPTDTGRTAPS
ncbi:hypothetical protein BG844_02070 [Couchioplanes caeruleus subsp. caeruleus]|uniref:Histidine kinase/HSP90-like ATPase domain-containing protein n=2 Tax=Couchioplanes caeruleus TaxID=56438 RepID=A0A1K0FSN9_9ACTN|nr:hypothetical protein BG844_02070 [Couchioplanes caeruleus subsp. caeruleus]